MVIRRSTRRWLCSWLGALLLVVQVAVSAYACPTVAAPAGDDPAMAEMVGCESHRGSQEPAPQPLLCKAHCQQGTDRLQPPPVDDAGAAPVLLALVAVLDWRPLAQEHGPGTARAASFDPGAAPPGTPPRYLSLQVLRN
jgi:hypothetical protein